MSNVVAQSLFHTAEVKRSWRTYVTSGLVHAFVIGLAFLIAAPAVKILQPPVRESITLIAPALPHYHPHIDPPRIVHTSKPELPAISLPQKQPVIPPPLPKPVPQQAAKVVPPPVAPAAPAPKIEAEAKVELPPIPKPVVKTGMFQEAQVAKAAPAPKQVQVGGFGDPHGVAPSLSTKQSPVLMAKVGAFESPTGAGQAGGGGHLQDGVKQTAFGSAGTPGGPAKTAGPVQTGGFGEGLASGNGSAPRGAGTLRSTGFGDTVAAPQRKETAMAPVAAFTPVEILFKPRPSYSSEARSLRLEGQVSLEVVFQASGAVRVVRVIRGLGHGLDEAAQQAAAQVRFKPATRSGTPVDTNATISITFELS